VNVATVLKVSLQSQKRYNSLKDVTEHQILCHKNIKRCYNDIKKCPKKLNDT